MTLQDTVPGIPGATIRRVEHLPTQLPGGVRAGPRAQAVTGQLLFVAPHIARFLARDGNLIEFVPDPDADPGAVTLFLNGTVRGALIHMRGELPLHAATLVPPGGDRALAICGPSGTGKSTLGAELSRRGWTLVADDTTRVVWDGDCAMAWPSRDSIKLWRDACEAAGLDIAGLERVTRKLDKYYVRVAARDAPIRLGTIVELAPDCPDTALSGGDKMALVSRNTYRPGQIKALGMQKAHVHIVARIATACAIHRLPGKGALPLAALAEAVERMVR
ncbi:MAG TPA: hypothetical protein VNU97_13835 [Rhizomicrobium sp.]|jgi:hypothetical protein|nr:hypothetical protein [Rhizomicrobium sp.]